MANPPRKIACIIASTDHGTLILNRLDYRMVSANSGFGIKIDVERMELEVLEGAKGMRSG
jgi:hypothetical protein